MSIRQDQAQLIITIDSKESVEYQKSVDRSNELVRNMKKLEAGTDEYNKALREQIEISKKLSGQDYSKLSVKNLTDRRRALQEQIRILPQAQAAELGLERELQRVNQALSENAARTRAVNTQMQRAGLGVKGFIAAYVSIGALRAFGSELFDQIKKIDSLNKAFKLLIPETDKRARADAFLTRLAKDYGLEIGALRDEYIKYNASAKASNLTLKDQELVFESVAKAGAVLGLSNETQGRAFTALQQIMSKGKVSAEELKGQLGDALPGAVTIMAKALGVGTGELQKMLEAGEVMADEALPKFAIELQKAYGVDQVKTIDTLSGAQNRFKNQATEVYKAIGEFAGPFLTRTFGLLTDYGKKLAEIISPTKTAAEETKILQNEFNNEIGVLKRLSPEAEGRRDIIEQINIKYKDYLPNLLSETASIKEIEAAQRAANKVFEEKLIFLAFEEEYQKQIDRTKQAVKQLAGAEIYRARAAQENENLGKIGASAGELEKQKKVNEQFADLAAKNAEEQINNNDKVVAELESAYDKAAKRIGSTLDGIRKKFATTDTPDAPKTGGGGGESSSAKKERERAEKEAAALLKKKLELQAKERDALLNFNPYDPAIAQAALDYRLKQLDEAAQREQLQLEESYLQGKISLEQYELEKLRITQGALATKIELLDTYGQTESDKRRALNVELLKIESDIVRERADQIADLENAALSEVEQRFAERLISEEEYNLSRLRVQLNFYDEQLRLLQENELTNTDVYKQILDARLKTQTDYNNQKIDNERRTAALQEAIQREGLSVAQDLFSLGAELLGQDEKARKKHASAIKAFESAAIFVNSLAEISAIHKKYAALPGGTFIAIAQSVATAVRAGIAISKVNAQQFYGSGRVKPYNLTGSQRISVSPNIPAQVGGDNVLAMVKPGEVILNQEHQAKAGGPSFFARLGVPGFNDGGIVRLPNTQPSLASGVINPQQQAPAQDNRIDMLMGVVSEMAAAVSNIPGAIANMNLKTHVVYSDLQNTADTINEIQRLSSY